MTWLVKPAIVVSVLLVALSVTQEPGALLRDVLRHVGLLPPEQSELFCSRRRLLSSPGSDPMVSSSSPKLPHLADPNSK